jgi:hypothetical protein
MHCSSPSTISPVAAFEISFGRLGHSGASCHAVERRGRSGRDGPPNCAICQRYRVTKRRKFLLGIGLLAFAAAGVQLSRPTSPLSRVRRNAVAGSRRRGDPISSGCAALDKLKPEIEAPNAARFAAVKASRNVSGLWWATTMQCARAMNRPGMQRLRAAVNCVSGAITAKAGSPIRDYAGDWHGRDGYLE